MSTATGVAAAARAGRRGPASWPGRLHRRVAAWPPWAITALGVLAWIAALAAVEPLVRGYLTSVPDQRMVDLNVYRTGGLSVLQGQPLYTALTQPPQLLPFTYPPAAALFAVPLALAWLFAWPYVLPWYDALAWALLPLVPLAPGAEGLTWLLLARTAALGFGYLPARQADAALPPGLGWLQPVIRHGVTPAVLAAATAWLVVLMVRLPSTAPGRLVRQDLPSAPSSCAPPARPSEAPARRAVN